jgi:truncated hemoglobin YjbI
MSACTTPQQMEQARARLVSTMATMGKAEAVRTIVTDFFARVDALQVATGQVWFSGTKAPEPRPTVTEQLDAMCARVASRRAQVAA